MAPPAKKKNNFGFGNTILDTVAGSNTQLGAGLRGAGVGSVPGVDRPVTRQSVIQGTRGMPARIAAPRPPSFQDLLRGGLKGGKATGNVLVDWLTGKNPVQQKIAEAIITGNKEVLDQFKPPAPTKNPVPQNMNPDIFSYVNQSINKAPQGTKLASSEGELAFLNSVGSVDKNQPLQEKYTVPNEQFRKAMDDLRGPRLKDAKGLFNQGKGPGEAGADPWAALKIFGAPKTTGGLSGDRNKDAETLRRLQGIGYDPGPIIRQKFVPIPGQSAPPDPQIQKGPQESEESFKARLDEFYSKYAGAFMAALNEETKDSMGLPNKRDIDQAKQKAVADTMSGLDPSLKNAIRNEQLGYQQRDKEMDEARKQQKQNQKDMENPLGLPGPLVAQLPGGLSASTFIPGINVADIAARVLKEKEYTKTQLDLTNQQAKLVSEAEIARRNGDQKTYKNRLDQANAIQATVDKLGGQIAAQGAPQLTPGKIALESGLAGLSFSGLKGAGMFKPSALKGVGRGISQDFASGPGYGAARTAGQLAYGTAGTTLGGGVIGAAQAGVSGESLVEGFKQGAGMGWPLGFLGLRGFRQNLSGKAPKEVITPKAAEVKPGRVELDLGMPEKAPTPKEVKPKNALHAILNAAQREQNKYTPGLKEKVMAPVRRLQQELFDPAAPLVRIDKAIERRTGKKVPRAESLEHFYDVYLNSASSAEESLNRLGAGKIFQKYKDDPEMGAYVVAKHAIEVQKKRGISLHDENGRPFSLASLKKGVKEYEAKNKDAQKDYEIGAKRPMDEALDDHVREGSISGDDSAAVREFYDTYFPLQKITPKGLEKPSVDAKPAGSIGEQHVLRDLEGGKSPVNPSLGVVLDRVVTARKELNRVRLSKLFAKRVSEGDAPGKIFQTTEQVKTRKGLKELADQVNVLRELSKKTYGSAVGRSQKSHRSVTQTQAKAAAEAKKSLKANVTSKEAKADIDRMSKKELVHVFDFLSGKTAPTISEAGHARTAATLDRRLAKRTALRKEVDAIKSELDELKGIRSEAREAQFSLSTDPHTNKPVISGLDDGGVPFKVEVDPEIYRTMQGLGQNPNQVIQAIRKASTPFRAAWTGWLNPLFTLVSYALYDPLATAVISRGGARALISPKAIGASLKSFHSNDAFTSLLTEHGMQRSTASMLPEAIRRPDFITAERTLGQKIKLALTHPKQTSDRLDVVMGKFMESSRVRIARWKYDDAIKNKMTKEQAVAEAVFAANNVMPNYVRVGNLARILDVVPYTAASIAGTRAQLKGLRNDKAAYAARLGTAVVLPGIASTMQNHSTEAGKRFYDDMISSGKESILDYNYIIVMPGAHKDEKTGEWEGIIKIPVAPEFRSIHRAVWRQTREAVTGNGLADPQIYAGAALDYLTGGTTPLGWKGTSEKDTSLQGGISKPNKVRFGLNENTEIPAVSLLAGLSTGIDPMNGREIVPGDLRYEDKQNQVTRGTSELAKWIGKTLNVSPLKAQYTLSQFGLPAKTAQGIAEGKSLGESLKDETVNKFTQAKGMSSGQQFSTLKESLTRKIKDPASRKIFEAMYTKKTGRSILDSERRAGLLLSSFQNNNDVWEAVKALNSFSKAKGETHDPLFDDTLPDGTPVTDTMRVQQLQYAAAGNLNKAKQTYSKSGEPLYTQLGLEQPNQQSLYNERSKFFAQLGLLGDSPYASGGDSLSGAPEPTLSPDLKGFQDQFFATPKGSRSGALAGTMGEQLKDFWKADNDFTNQERSMLGLKSLPAFGESFSSGGSGGRSGGRKRSGGGARKPKKMKIKKAKKAKKGRIKKPKQTSLSSLLTPKKRKRSGVLGNLGL